MRTFVFTKKDTLGNDKYLKADGNFSYDIKEAKEYKGQFWIELLKILIQLVAMFGIGQLKVKK